MSVNVIKIAHQLFREHKSLEPFHPLSGVSLEAETDAYAVQDKLVELFRVELGEIVGYKIGLTSQRMQEKCGIGSPVSGMILDRRQHKSGMIIRMQDHGRLALEFEIGVRIKNHLGGGPISVSRVAEAVECVCASIELVDDRDANYAVLDSLSLIADNVWNAGIVTGDWVSEWPPLESVVGTIFRDGIEMGRGMGKDVLGHPFTALVWLSNHLAANGKRLEKGDIVLTGSLVAPIFPDAPATYSFEVVGVGDVQVNVIP